MPAIGGFTFQSFGAGNHNWAEGMSNNMLKASTLLQPSAISRTTNLPASANNFDCYIDPSSKNIATWFNGQWYTIAPRIGAWVFVQDANEYAHFNLESQWVTGLDLDAVPSTPIERTLAFYNPGLIRPNSILFHYVAGMEFTIPANAPGSGAILETPPIGGSIVFPILTSTGNSGNISFAAGSVNGVIYFPAEAVIHASFDDGQYTPADVFRIRSPADLLGATGLAVTIRGKIRAMD